jgi:hypothetical protein
VHKFVDHCHRLETQLQLLNNTSYISLFIRQQVNVILGTFLPDSGSTSTQVKGELEVTITYVYGHEISDTI